MATKRETVKAIVVMVTCASKREAKTIATALVTKRLAACGNVVGFGVRSIYRWKGKMESAHETLLLLKTTTARFDELEKEIRRLHSYDVPEIIALPILAGSVAYLNWIAENTKRK